MMITNGSWAFDPYLGHGSRCWQVRRVSKGGKVGKAMRYYDDLADAMRFAAEYSLRNDEDGTADLDEAIRRYESIAAALAEAATSAQIAFEGSQPHPQGPISVGNE